MAYWIVGSEAVMRESSSTLPSLIGTLKSTRINSRWPESWRSRIESLATKVDPSTDYADLKRLCNLWMALKSFGSDVLNQIANAARVAPLVVVPRKHFQHSATNHLCIFRVDDRRVWVALEVH